MENVSCSENTLEINYILETSAWRQPSAGITKAVEYIQNYGIPEGKDCRIIVLDNNIPQFSLYYLHNNRRVPPNFKSIRQQWDVSYNIGDEWNLLRSRPFKSLLPPD